MSSVLIDSLPHRSPRREVPERRIEIVSTRAQRRARPRPLYAIVAIGGVFGLFMAQLLMSIVVSDGAYQISSLQSQQVELGRQQQSLGEKVATLASTQNLATKAEALGMVQSTSSPAFLDAATGKVVGISHAAKASANGVLDSTGSLVPNALLPDTSADDSITVDGTTDAAVTGTASTTADTTAGTTADTVVTDPTDPGTTDAIATGTDSVALDTGDTAGAPATATSTTQVTSESGLPVPATR